MEKRAGFFGRSEPLITIPVPAVTLVLGEAFTHLFNTLLDASLLERMIFTFRKPFIFILMIVMQTILRSIEMLLSPLGRFLASRQTGPPGILRRPQGGPWRTMGAHPHNHVVLDAGTIVFYALNDWKSPGGTPLGWVLSFKISEGLLSATLNALIVNLVLLGPRNRSRWAGSGKASATGSPNPVI